MIRIDEALARAKSNGLRVLKKDLAAKLWPDSVPATQSVNISRLCKGETKSISEDWVRIICTETGCSADFLFGLSND